MFGKMIDDPNGYVLDLIEKENIELMLDRVCRDYELLDPEDFLKALGRVLLLLSNACLAIFDHESNFETCVRALPDATTNVLLDQKLYDDFERLNYKNLDSTFFLKSDCKNIVHLTEWINAYNKFLDDMKKTCHCPCVEDLKIKPKQLSKELLENPKLPYFRDKGDGKLHVTYTINASEIRTEKVFLFTRQFKHYKISICIDNPHYYPITEIHIVNEYYKFKKVIFQKRKRYQVLGDVQFDLYLNKHNMSPTFEILIDYDVDKGISKTWMVTIDDK